MLKKFKLFFVIFLFMTSFLITTTFNVCAGSYNLEYIKTVDYGTHLWVSQYDYNTYIFAMGGTGLRLYNTTDGLSFYLLDTITYGSGYDCRVAETDGVYVYAIMEKDNAHNYLCAYSVNETYQLTFLDDYDVLPANNLDHTEGLEVDVNGYIHVSSWYSGLFSFSFDGSEFTLIDSEKNYDDYIGIDSDDSNASRIYTIGYTGSEIILEMYDFDGSSLTLITSRTIYSTDGCICYFPNCLMGTDYVSAPCHLTGGNFIYQYNGSALELIDNWDTATGDDSRFQVDFYDGNNWNIYQGMDDNGIAYWTWDSVSGDSLIAQLDNGSDYASWNIYTDLSRGYLYTPNLISILIYDIGYIMDTCPIDIPSPANQSVNVSIDIGKYSVYIMDIDGNNTNGTLELSSGQSKEWNNMPNGYQNVSLPTLNYFTTYYAWVNYTSVGNPSCTFNKTYWFKTELEELPEVELTEGGSICDLRFYNWVMAYEYYKPLTEFHRYVDCPFPDDWGYFEPILSKYIEIEGTDIISGKIHYVDLYVSSFQRAISDNPNDYHLEVNGFAWTEPPEFVIGTYPLGQDYIRWFNNEGTNIQNETPVFEFYYSGEPYDYFVPLDLVDAGFMQVRYICWFLGFMDNECGLKARKHGDSSLYGNGIVNGAPLTNKYKLTDQYTYAFHPVAPYFKFYYNSSYYNPSGEEPIPPEELEDLIDFYGEYFIEFWDEFGQSCYYHEGDSPEIVYRINESMFSPYQRLLIYDIVYTSTNETVYSDYITYPANMGFNYSAKIDLTGKYIFEKSGNYQIRLYNSTNYFTRYEHIMSSQTILEVCEWDEPIEEPTASELDIPALFDEYFAWDFQFIIGLILILFGFISIGMVAKKYDLQNMPTLVYFMGGLCGFIIAVQWELFEFWMVVILVFAFTVLIIWNIFGHFGNFAETVAKPIQKFVGTKPPKEEKAKSIKTRQTRLFNNEKAKEK
jgi:hypothetical protein